jgi:hypothetical protein
MQKVIVCWIQKCALLAVTILGLANVHAQGISADVAASFVPPTVFVNTTSTLTITLTSTGGLSVPNVSGTFTVPAGLTIVATPTNTCGGTFTIGVSSVTLTGGTIIDNTTSSICTISIPVASSSNASLTFTIPKNSVSYIPISTPVNIPLQDVSATLSIVSPLTLTPAFSPTQILANGTSTLTITARNFATASGITALQGPFNLPAGMFVAAGATSNTCGGSLLATPGASSITLSGGAVPAASGGLALLPGVCVISVPITTAVAGSSVVTIPANSFSFNYIGATANSFATTAALLVTAPPQVSLAIAPISPVNAGTAVNLVVTYRNPELAQSTITSGSISIPVGLTVTGLGTNTCGGTNTGSGNVVGLLGGLIPAATLSTPSPIPGSCTQTIPLQTPSAGNFPISYAIGALTTSTGANTVAAASTLVVNATAPTVSLSWSTTTQTLSASVTAPTPITLSIFFSNTNLAPVTALNSSITIPSGLTVTNVTTTCPTGVNSAAGVNPVTLTGGTIPAAIASAAVIPGVCRQDITFTTTAAATPYSIPYGNFTSSAGAVTGSTPAVLVVSGVSVNPLALTFGAQIVGTSSPVQNVTVTAIGLSAQLTTINIASATGTFSAVLLAPCGPLPYTIPVSASCTAAVVFSPASATPATQNGTLAIGTSAGNLNVLLAGTASPVPVPGLTLAPTALNFGPQPTNTQTIQNIIATNTGTANLILSSILSTNADFRVTAATINTFPQCGTTLAPAASCVIGVGYGSFNGGVATGQLNITTNLPTITTVPLAGTSVVPAVRLIGLDSPINFGDQIVGTSSAAVTPSIRNTGTAPITVSGLSVTGANASDFVLTGACTIIPVGGSCSLSLAFNPTAVGIRNAQINVLSNAVNTTTSNTIALVGNGIPAPAPRVDFNITAIAFGNTIFGGAAPSQVVTLTNGGTLPLVVQSVLSSPEFVQMNNCPATLAPQQTCSIMISFTPLGLGQREGELILTSNTATSPNRIPLAGVGCRWFSPAGTRLFVSLCGN